MDTTVPNVFCEWAGKAGASTVCRSLFHSDSTLARTSSVVRVGAVSYLNSKPLIHRLDEALGNQGVLSTDLPSRLADQLVGNEIDVGLIPVVEYLRNPNFQRVSSSGIVCKGPVWSVRIFFRGNPLHVSRIALDEGSRTSAALSRVLLHARLGYVPETCLLPMNASPETIDADAVLLIGDRAMHPEQYRETFESDWDLGQTWWEETGLPFVFAAWVSRQDGIDLENMGALLDGTRERGKRAISEIALHSAAEYRLTPAQCIDYLTNYIRFELDDAALSGLELFRKRCQHLNLVPNGSSSG